jgi:type I restriction enzyme S subunit
VRRIEQDVRQRKAADQYSDPVKFIDIPIKSLPFQVPEYWRWARLTEIVDISYGFAFESARFNDVHRGMPLIRIRDISRLDTEAYYDGPYDDYYIVHEGDHVVGMDGDFKVQRWRGREALLNQRVMRLTGWRASLLPEFLIIPLQMILDHLHESTSLTTVKHLSARQVNGIYLPLPPIAEQHRIVKKVDELMSQCNGIELAQSERERRHQRLVSVTCNLLRSRAEGDSQVQDTIRLILENISKLTARPEYIKQLREAIRNLAVCGRLVSQVISDEPAVLALSRSDIVRAETAKKDRRADPEPQGLLAQDLRWHVPASWQWRGLADLALFIDYRGSTPQKAERGIRLLTAKNVRKGVISRTPEEFVSAEDYASWMTRGFPKSGDILFTTEAPMGNAAVVRLKETFALAQRVICLSGYGAVDPDFLVLQILSEPFQSVLDATGTGLTAKGIKSAKLKRLPIAVPPPPEQRRIVAKVNELFGICDWLETKLLAGHAQSERLLEAVLTEALAISAQSAA